MVIYSNTKEMVVIARIVFMFAVASVSICCLQVSKVNFDEDRQRAVSSTNEFHALFNDQRFEEIYGMTDERARESKNKDGLISILTTLRNERGRVTKAELIDTKIEPKSTYREVHLSFRTKFENAETIERFVWYVSDKKAALFSFESE